MWSNWYISGFKLVAFGSVPPRSCDSIRCLAVDVYRCVFVALVSMETHPSQYIDACREIISISPLINKNTAAYERKEAAICVNKT